MAKYREKCMETIFLFAACLAILSIAIISSFLFANGIPAIHKVGVGDFLKGREWKPSSGRFGIAPMIAGSLFVTAGAVLLGAPVGILSAAFLAKFCPKPLYKPLKAGTHLMAGIPSVVYGFFGLGILVPLVRRIFGGDGNSMLTASLLLGFMILPTIISISETAVRSVPESYYQGALALGATHEKSVFSIVLPAARSGILTAVALGIGRAVGETMAVIMVAGNQARMPRGILRGVRTMTANIVIEMGYATGLHRELLIATGTVLFLFILIIQIMIQAATSERLSKRREAEK